MLKDDWSLSNLPPQGDPDVAEFGFRCFEIARLEKERLNKRSDFYSNYALYRGNQRRQISGRKGFVPQQKDMVPVNLYFANVERTVSNITARNPTGEVVDLDGTGDDAEKVLTMQLKKWWKDTYQQQKTRASARQMEIYGITIEKPVWDTDRDQPDIMLTDPFQFFPAPGYYDDISEEAPYVCFAYVERVDKIESDFGVEDIAHEESFDLLGAQREEFKPRTFGLNQTIGNYADPMTIKTTEKTVGDKMVQRGLIIEIWVRDNSTKQDVQHVPILDDNQQQTFNDHGEALVAEITTTKPVYRDGIRKITISKSKSAEAKCGWVVIDDSANPNLNPALEDQLAIFTFPWGKMPVYYSNSYKDGVSIWGFSAAEQVGDLLAKLSTIVNKLIAYVINVMAPPLIIQQHCGITRDMIENSILKAGRLVLMPSVANARIEFMQIPNLPETFFKVLDLIVRFFDRIYQIEDADRGNAPRRIVAASAIVALQERNQVMMQSKTVAIDSLAENRSRWAIGLWQNKGTREEHVNVAGASVSFRPTALAGRKFNYVVESGSTTPRTSLQIQELATSLFEMKAIDLQALLENLSFPNWKEILMRMGSSQLDQAINVLMEAGLPPEMANMIKQVIDQAQQEMAAKKQGGNPGARQPAAQPAAQVQR